MRKCTTHHICDCLKAELERMKNCLEPHQREVEACEYQKAVENILYWQDGQTFFTAQLYELMMKADTKNWAKLACVFPVEGKAFSDWYHSNDPDKFLEDVAKMDLNQELPV